ncbi:hypothetical protein AAF712_016588 [Marasmius tenuissimus]|uniref:Uncharacterized protein n=1 Tax=Marasmius tenuissimus TaxID=585030 RepID=A0ABR2Z5L5_9AGAR
MDNTRTLYADAVLFDMDGSLTDSISAVEAAWANSLKILVRILRKRAIDNLRKLRPALARANTEEMNNQVHSFEESILFYADATISMAQGLERTHTYITRTRDT